MLSAIGNPNELRCIQGPNLTLRLINSEDASYLHGLRTDPTYNQHLSEVIGTIEDQHRWIDSYKLRETSGRELYYIIARRDGTRCGTVRLYDISDESFTWGSWILDHNKSHKAALESAVLSFGAGFQVLELDRANVCVRKENSRAETFYRRLGMSEIYRTEQDIFFIYSRVQFNADRDGYLSILNCEALK